MSSKGGVSQADVSLIQSQLFVIPLPVIRGFVDILVNSAHVCRMAVWSLLLPGGTSFEAYTCLFLL